MLNLHVEDFNVELTEGSIRNVGAPTKSATAKLFDPSSVECRGFGDSQAKLVASDDDGNEIQVALAPEQAAALRDDIAGLMDRHEAFE